MFKLIAVLILFAGSCFSVSAYDEFDDDEMWWLDVPSVPIDQPAHMCKRDIVILWDNSNTIGVKYFDDSRDFVVDLIGHSKFNQPGSEAQFKIVSFSSKTSQLFENVKNNKELIQKMKKLTFSDVGGPLTLTGKAFEIASKIFSKKSPDNMRPGVPDVIILLTDGVPNPKEQQTMAERYANMFKKDKKIPIVGLAISGLNVVIKTTKDLASKGRFFNTVITKVGTVVNDIVRSTCRPPAACFCAKSGNEGGIVFVKKGTKAVSLSLETPKLTCPRDQYTLSSSGEMASYPVQDHKIPYVFTITGQATQVTCFNNFTVKECGCPPTQTVNVKIPKPGQEAVAMWTEPKPLCNVKPDPSNPSGTSATFNPGRHNVVYKYDSLNSLHSFTLKCVVELNVPGQYCGSTVYYPSREICCCGKVYTKKTGSRACCGDKYINLEKKICCGSGPKRIPYAC